MLVKFVKQTEKMYRMYFNRFSLNRTGGKSTSAYDQMSQLAGLARARGFVYTGNITTRGFVDTGTGSALRSGILQHPGSSSIYYELSKSVV